MECATLLQICSTLIQICATIFIGLLALKIQRKILKAHKEKLHSDSFDRKYKIFDETIEYMRSVVNYNWKEKKSNEFFYENILFRQRTITKAKFLFSDEVTSFMEKIANIASDLNILHDQKEQLGSNVLAFNSKETVGMEIITKTKEFHNQFKIYQEIFSASLKGDR